MTLLQNRRSIPPALMNGNPVEDDVLLRVLEAARWAPSHRGSEPWFFQVFRGEARLKLCQAMVTAYCTENGAQALEKKIAKLQQNTQLAGAILSVEMRIKQPPRNPESEDILAMGAAVQNLHLMAHALGLAGYWTTPSWVDQASFRHFLGLETGMRSFGLFYLGYSQRMDLAGSRDALSEKWRSFT
ncbi:MAG: nitroreductase [Acidobacteria bacterium]|nr:nitroreductase [Acidobacteriota bacterium]